MKLKPNSASSRIVEALRLKPMTVQQLAGSLCLRDEYVRTTMLRMEEGKLVRRAGLAPKAHTGVTPYLWEAA